MQNMDDVKTRLYRVFDKVSANANLVSVEAKGLTSEEARAAAEVAQAILAIETAQHAGLLPRSAPAANTNKPGAASRPCR